VLVIVTTWFTVALWLPNFLRAFLDLDVPNPLEPLFDGLIVLGWLVFRGELLLLWIGLAVVALTIAGALAWKGNGWTRTLALVSCIFIVGWMPWLIWVGWALRNYTPGA